MKTCRTIIVAFALVAHAAIALALPTPAGDHPASSNRRDNDPALGADDGIARTVGLMFLHMIRTELELSDEQVLRLLPLIEEIEQTRRASFRSRRQIADRLRLLAEDPEPKEAEVTAAIRELDDEEQRARTEQNAQRDRLLSHLQPRQRALFVVHTNRLRQRLEMDAGPGRPGHEGGPAAGRRGESWRRARPEPR